MPKHRYSGWPGAWCLDCGVPDPLEEALAHGCDKAICVVCKKNYPMGDDPCAEGIAMVLDPCASDEELGIKEIWYYPHEIHFTEDCGQHGSQECTEPGSRRFDPYYVG